MRKILSILCALGIMAFASIASAFDISVAWNANTESDLAGYKVYTGPASRNYNRFLDVGKVTTATLSLPDVAAGTPTHIAVTAYDDAPPRSATCPTCTGPNESGFSNELVVLAPTPPPDITPPADPKNLIIIKIEGMSGEPTFMSVTVNGKKVTWEREN